MQELSERQKLVLTLVIHEHIRSAAPVGSHSLVEQYHLDLSSATIRNELAALTDMGYLRQPHTSAGRMPSEEGYRYFVTRLLQTADLPEPTQRMISHQFYQMDNDQGQRMKLAASVLAHQSQAASLVTSPRMEKARLKHLELISTRGRQVLVVLVMQGGEISQRLLTVEEPASQADLSTTAARLTALYQGMDSDGILTSPQPMSAFEQQAAAWAASILKEADSVVAGEVYMDGLMNILSEPEFNSSEEARRAFRLLEERGRLEDLLSRSLQNTGVGGVQVLIGGEGNWDDLRQFSFVLARYGSPGLATGALGVLGPMRMSYGRTISLVRFLSGLMSDMVTDTLADGQDEQRGNA